MRAARFALAGLPLLLLVALFIVELPALRARASGFTEPSAMLDAESAWHARRVTVGITSARFPQSDRLLAHPREVEFPDPPLFDAVLALAARGMLGANAGGAREGPPEEGALERFLAQVGPVSCLALLVALALGLRRPLAALLGAALVAFSPEVFAACAAGRVEVAAFAAFLLVMQLGLARAAWRTDDALDRLQNALLAGLVTGLGLASTPLFVGAALGAWGGFLADACSVQGSAARDRARAGLLFSIGALLPAQLPAMDGPWRAAQDGPVAEWAALSGGFLLAGCALFGALFLARVAQRATARMASIVVASVAVASCAVLFVAPAGAGLARPLRAALRVDVVPGESAFTAWLAQLAPPLALAGLTLWLVAAAVLARPLRAVLGGPERLCFTLAIAWGAIAAAVHPPAGLLFLVPIALVVAPALTAGSKLARSGAVVVALAFSLGLARLAQATHVDASERARAAEAVTALRWLRANSPASGAWTVAGAVHDYGVLAEPELAGLVPYHARRPALDAGARACADPATQADVRAVLAAVDGAALVRAARALGARYLVARAGGPLSARLAEGAELGIARIYAAPGPATGTSVYALEPAAGTSAPRTPQAQPYLSK